MNEHAITAKEQWRILTALRQTTARLADIARDHGRSVDTIRKIAHAHNISLRGRE